MRIGTMIKQLLEEVRAAPLDEASRNRLREIHPANFRQVLIRSSIVLALGPQSEAEPGSGTTRTRAETGVPSKLARADTDGTMMTSAAVYSRFSRSIRHFPGMSMSVPTRCDSSWSRSYCL